MGKNTRKNKAYNYLREAILTGKTPPGSPVLEQEVSDELGISRTPVREALKLLEAEGLLKVLPQRGSFVAELSTQDVEEIFALREVLEVLALQAAIHTISEQELDELEQFLKSLTPQCPAEQFYESDRRLHGLIVNHGGNSRLVRFVDMLNAQVERVRRISALRPNRLDVSIREHMDILQAIRSKNLSRAEIELRKHIENVKSSALEVCRNRNVWTQRSDY